MVNQVLDPNSKSTKNKSERALCEKILILDFGSQYTELIARKTRELNIYSEVHPYDYPLDKIVAELPNSSNSERNPESPYVLKGIILSGGPNSIYDEDAPKCDPGIFELGLPILGICYGKQLIAHELSGKVVKGDFHEYGLAELNLSSESELVSKLPKDFQVWMSHADRIEELPPGFEVLATTSNTPAAIMANQEKKIYGLQFHPEVSHSEYGKELLENFLVEICGASQSWDMHDFIENSIAEIRAKVGDKKVLLALSGGVDSSTLAFLLKKAIGDQLICFFIDHGFMRMNEPEELMATFKEKFGMQIDYVDAKDRFWEALAGASDPEHKRKVIGNEFIRCFEEECEKLKEEYGEIEYLAQGTLYPDIIESSGIRIDPKTGKKVAATIKTHHNVGGLPEKMNFKLLEPLKTLFKDEVRRLARELDVPDEIVRRHPFPGPGLAIRVLGEITREKLDAVRLSDLIMREELDAAGAYDSVWQILTAILPVRSVGVMGDKRTYSHPIVIRAVTSEDAMTADWAKLPYELLGKISNRIVNEVAGVNRVVYDITSKPPGTIEWE